MKAAQNAVPIPGASRFNWKDGFYKQDEAVSKSGTEEFNRRVTEGTEVKLKSAPKK
jgi:hypothetical protein